MQSRFSTFDTEERDDDNLDGRQPHDEHSARLGGVQDAATVITLVARRCPMHPFSRIILEAYNDQPRSVEIDMDIEWKQYLVRLQPHDKRPAQLGGVHEAATVIEAATQRMLHRGLLDWLRRKAQYEESCIAR